MADNSSPGNKETYDVIVIGGGLMGASTARALAKDGKRILLLDANGKHHELGSSHGQARASRIGNESAVFPRMGRDSLEVMRNDFPGVAIKPMPTLFVTTKDSSAHTELMRFAYAQQTRVTLLPSELVKKHYGLLALPENQIGIRDENSATFNPHTLLDELYEDIESSGNSVRFNCAVTAWQNMDGKIHVRAGSDSIEAQQLVIAAGAWTPEVLRRGRTNSPKRILDRLNRSMITERIPVFYFEYPNNVPDTIFLEYAATGSAVDRGVPRDRSEDNLEVWALPEVLLDGTKTLKVGFYYGNKIVDSVAKVDREVSEKEISQATNYMKKWFGEQPLKLVHSTICLNARVLGKDLPLIGRVPGTENVYLLSHTGYAARYAIAFGEGLSAMMQGEEPPYAMKEFSPSRVIHETDSPAIH